MVKKQVIGFCISVILLLLLGATVMYYSGYDLQDLFVQSTGNDLDEFFNSEGLFKPVKEETKLAINDLSKAYELILEKGTKEFFEGYPIDHAFLMWMNKTLGDEPVMDIAYRMYEGYEEADLWYRETGNTMHVLWLMYCKDKQFATYYLDNVYWKESTDDMITIDFTGDINFADEWYTMQALSEKENGIYDCISKEIILELQSADISVINNEFVFTDGGERQLDKAYTFGAKTENVSMLKVFGADLANLANNHVFDYGESGLLDTIETLENANIVTMGAGENLNEAKEIQYFVVNGRKIAFVAATEIERYASYTRRATLTDAGVFKTEDMEILEECIREAKKNSDYVIVNAHWGTEGSFRYTGSQYNMAAGFIRAGADVVIGGHPHRLQGIEYINDAPVVFSMGNFWFSTGTLYTTIAQIQIDKTGEISLRMIPCIQKDLTTSMLSEKESENFYKFMADISRNIAIDEKGYIYDTSAQPEEKTQEGIWYFSGREYDTYTGSKDLEGRGIDIVGNLQ